MFTPDSRPKVSAVLLFARRDQPFAEELETHLHIVPGLELWHEGMILPGAPRQDAINDHLRAADLVLVLVGRDLLASPEFESALQVLELRRARSDVHIVPILVRASSWQHSRLAGMTPLPRNGKVVAAWGSRDEAWAEIATEVLHMVSSEAAAAAAPPGGAGAASGRPSVSGSLPDHEQFYDALIQLLPAQWSELLIRLGLPTHALSTASVAASTRAAELLTLVAQRGDRELERLAGVLDRVAPGLLARSAAAGARETAGPPPFPHGSSPPNSTRPAPSPRMQDAVSVIVLTALPLECRAVLHHLTDTREEELESGTLVDVGTLATPRGPVPVGVVEVGAGNIPTAATAQEVFSRFKPSAVLFVGVAGGLKDVRIGDVVAATRVYGFESGKAADDFLARPDVAQSSHRLIQRARAVARHERWRERLEPESSPVQPSVAPQVYIGPIAAGSQVVASTRSPLYQFLVRQYSDALAVEMEGRGFLEAAWRNQIDALVVRGISDLIDKKGESDATGSQPLAARNAAAFAVEVITNLFGR